MLDLGVTRSDCCYDVVHVWRGRFYRLDAHLDRFAASIARLRLDPGHDRSEIESILHGCVRLAGLREAYVSMTCTRGRTRGRQPRLADRPEHLLLLRRAVRVDQPAGPAGRRREHVDQPGDAHPGTEP